MMIFFNGRFVIPYKGSIKNFEKIREVFRKVGLTAYLHEVELRSFCTVICTDESVWFLDNSHGGGGFFEEIE